VDQSFDVVEKDEGGFIQIDVRGEVDVATAPVLREKLNEAIDRGSSPIVLDLSTVTFIDSTALGVLIGAQERCQGRASELRIVASEPRIIKIFEITGLTDLFSIFPTIGEAAAG
jgi:anti-sigma B factor antagonist